jgi:hypothetical protein
MNRTFVALATVSERENLAQTSDQLERSAR